MLIVNLRRPKLSIIERPFARRRSARWHDPRLARDNPAA
jgi:hypothetical protein